MTAAVTKLFGSEDDTTTTTTTSSDKGKSPLITLPKAGDIDTIKRLRMLENGKISPVYRDMMLLFTKPLVTRDRIKSEGGTVPWSSLVSASDEAFIVLQILNAWNVWNAEDETMLAPVDKGWAASGKTLYTVRNNNKTRDKEGQAGGDAGQVGSQSDEKVVHEQRGGWTTKGLKKYVELMKLVKADRERYGRVFDEAMAHEDKLLRINNINVRKRGEDSVLVPGEADFTAEDEDNLCDF